MHYTETPERASLLHHAIAAILISTALIILFGGMAHAMDAAMKVRAATFPTDVYSVVPPPDYIY